MGFVLCLNCGSLRVFFVFCPVGCLIVYFIYLFVCFCFILFIYLFLFFFLFIYLFFYFYFFFFNFFFFIPSSILIYLLKKKELATFFLRLWHVYVCHSLFLVFLLGH